MHTALTTQGPRDGQCAFWGLAAPGIVVFTLPILVFWRFFSPLDVTPLLEATLLPRDGHALQVCFCVQQGTVVSRTVITED